MTFKIKRIREFLWINKKISDFFIKWITIKDFRKEDSHIVKRLQPSIIFNINLRYYTIYGPSPFWESFSNLKSDPLFYAKIYQATILSKGIVLNKKKEVILESTIFQLEYLNVLCSNHLVKLQKFIPFSRENKVLSLLNKLDNNYYHWTLESLTRILLVYDSPFFRNYKIIIKHGALPFIKTSLQFLFNISESQIIEKPLYKKIIAKEALVVSFPHIRNKSTNNINAYYPFIIKQLNELANKRLREKEVKTNTPKNIIIFRENALQRKILNYRDIEETLHEYNFKSICLENLTYIEQVSLFANANIVIAAHGAGITNVIYGKNLLLFEFFPKQRNIRDPYYFAQITGALNIEHHTFLLREENNKQDFFIDKDTLKKIDEIIKSKNIS